MDYRKKCSDCGSLSDETNKDVFGKIICGECGIKSHCFCEDCGEYVPTSHCTVVDEVLEWDMNEIDQTKVICNVCEEISNGTRKAPYESQGTWDYLKEDKLKKESEMKNNQSYDKVFTRKLKLQEMPDECFILVNPYDHDALSSGKKVKVVKVKVGIEGFYSTHNGGKIPMVSSWSELHKLNKDVFGITDLNIVNVMEGQSYHGKIVLEIEDHNENVNYGWREKNKPEEGKIYALTGGVGDKCIANGDSWKDSVVKKKK